MRKIKSSLQDIVQDIQEFYRVKEYHFMTLNGVALEANLIEVQWIFASYEEGAITLFYVQVSEDALIPSIAHLIPSAMLSQREIVDMFGLKVEDSQRGLYLDEDSLQKPLTLGCAL